MSDMDFSEKILDYAAKVNGISKHISNEEMAKNSLVMPFLDILGYDSRDPRTVRPEYTADIGTKKGEKVDIAVFQEDSPVLLIECKCCGDPLDQGKANQLNRYFQNTPTARIGILTDGIRYKFFSDLDQPNIMDDKPFMELNFAKLDESLIPELRKLSKAKFDVEDTLSAAQNLKYTRELMKVFARQLQDPNDDFVKFLSKEVYSGSFTAAVKEEFRTRVKDAINAYINELLNARLQSAITKPEVAPPDAEEEEVEGPKVVTTESEYEGFIIVKSLLRGHIDTSRVFMRDTQSYCGILLDDNNRKPICRLYFNNEENKQLVTLDANKKETRHTIESLDEILDHAEAIRAAALAYDNQ